MDTGPNRGFELILEMILQLQRDADSCLWVQSPVCCLSYVTQLPPLELSQPPPTVKVAAVAINAKDPADGLGDPPVLLEGQEGPRPALVGR